MQLRLNMYMYTVYVFMQADQTEALAHGTDLGKRLVDEL